LSRPICRLYGTAVDPTERYNLYPASTHDTRRDLGKQPPEIRARDAAPWIIRFRRRVVQPISARTDLAQNVHAGERGDLPQTGGG